MSYRLGGTDGVAIEAAKWAGALTSLGHQVRTVAGEGVADLLVPGLAAGATRPPSLDELAAALASDLVVVENLASLPLNEPARQVLFAALWDRPAVLHHHDLPWQRAHLAHLAGPPARPRWVHVTINELSRHQLAERGVAAETIPNHFDCDPPPGRREQTRALLGVDEAPLALVPTRVIERKNLPGALSLSHALGATTWILGPAEDGYGPTLEALLADHPLAVVRGRPEGVDVHDAYAACDLVVMASTWEGFGNPVLESVTHRRPLALHPYPVAREIAAHGFRFFDLADARGLADFLAQPDEGLLDANLEVARRDFDLARLPARLAALLADPRLAPDR